MKHTVITKENFEEEVKKSASLVVLDFWATWCGPCRMVAAEFDEISDDEAPSVKLCKVNVDEQPELADEYAIKFIPDLIFVRNGEVVFNESGYKTKEQLLELFAKYGK